MMGQSGTNIGSIKVGSRVDVAGVFQCGINRQKEPISNIGYKAAITFDDVVGNCDAEIS